MADAERLDPGASHGEASLLSLEAALTLLETGDLPRGARIDLGRGWQTQPGENEPPERLRRRLSGYRTHLTLAEAARGAAGGHEPKSGVGGHAPKLTAQTRRLLDAVREAR